MEKFIKLIFNKENVHLAIILAVMFACFSSLNAKMDVRLTQMEAKMDVRFAEMEAKMTRENAALREDFNSLRQEFNSLRQDFDTLKNNDIAHIYTALEALTFTMVKNKLLTQEDKEYIDSRLKSR